MLPTRWMWIYLVRTKKRSWISTSILTIQTCFLSSQGTSISFLKSSNKYWCANRARINKSKPTNFPKSSPTKSWGTSICQLKAIPIFLIWEIHIICTPLGEKASTNDLYHIYTQKYKTQEWVCYELNFLSMILFFLGCIVYK